MCIVVLGFYLFSDVENDPVSCQCFVHYIVVI